MSILAIIPARAGSKRLPGKNLRPFCGKALWKWSVEQALRIKEIDKVVVTTDCGQNILDLVDERGQSLPMIRRRPAHLCRDDTPMAHVITDVLANCIFWPSLVVLLQPTSPTRTDETVRECISVALDLASPVKTVDPDHGDANGACYAFPPNYLPPFHAVHEIETDDIDINTLEDFERAEAVMRERLGKGLA